MQNLVALHFTQEYLRIQFANALDIPIEVFSFSVSAVSAAVVDLASTAEAEHVCDTASRSAAIHQQQVAFGSTRRQHPFEFIFFFVKPMLLALNRPLYPHLSLNAE